ncbi:MAG TPA: phage capsid protein, partial [Ruminococcus sp.]|nr:phage capsid protein [Ruminococcus sp.]
MLTPSQYDAIADQIVDLYSKLNESIVEDIARRIMKTGTISESARWQLKQLQESGMLYDDVIAEISKINYQSQQEIQNLFRNAGIESVRNDNIFYKPTGNQVLRLSDSALQVLNAGYQKCAGNLQNLTLTTANNAQQLYLDACNLAYLQVTSGAMDYGTAIRKAVQTASQQGSMVSYPSGHRDQLDVAVRRAVLTGVGQTVRQISVINANDMGCDLMEITAHAGARPSHAHWQGQIVSLSGRRGYLTVRDIGYGDADGFGGINCRHDWYPFFEGISQRTYSPERLQELENHRIQIGDKSYTDYEVSQMQRRLERDIREKKRLVAGARASVDSAPDEPTKKQMQELFTNASVRLKKAEKKLDDFC